MKQFTSPQWCFVKPWNAGTMKENKTCPFKKCATQHVFEALLRIDTVLHILPDNKCRNGTGLMKNIFDELTNRLLIGAVEPG